MFTWADEEDEELYRNGSTILLVCGRTKAIQKFIEDLSYKIGYKCDFAFSAGRAHIDVPKEHADEAIEVISDDKFMNKYIVHYSNESYENETYFEVLH
jgi:hypothetical protein